MAANPIDDFLNLLNKSLEKGELVRVTLSKSRVKNAEPKKITIKPVALKSGIRYAFSFQFHTRDEVKNHTAEETIAQVKTWLQNHFLEANLFTISEQHTLLSNLKGNGRLLSKKTDKAAMPDLSHDRVKQRLVKAGSSHWHLLGMTDTQGQLLASMQHKFRQINKYIEILDGLIPPELQQGKLRVLDMGAGKGYLTFALYEHLRNNLKLQAEVTGVELRPELVAKTNAIAAAAKLEGLHFAEGSISTYPIGEVDVLIALHACDTATDDAIAAGIAAGAKLIVCAPCCHKQIRREMQANAPRLPMLQYGILFERQAEILTDTLRALIMEKHGYQTHIQEFIEAEHTPKNVLLSGIRMSKPASTHETVAKIDQIKRDYGIKDHFLELALQQKGVRP